MVNQASLATEDPTNNTESVSKEKVSRDNGLAVSKDDEQWIRSVFEMIPKSVYYGGASNNGTKNNSKTAKQAKKSGVEDEKSDELQKVIKKKKKPRRNKTKHGMPQVNESDPKRQQLKEKLAEKVDELRAERNASPRAETEKKKTLKTKRRRDSTNIDADDDKRPKTTPKAKKVRRSEAEDDELSSVKGNKSAESGFETNLETTLITGFKSDGKEDDRTVKEPRRRKVSKIKSLEQKLGKAVKEREIRIDAAEKKGNVEGKAMVREMEMEKALARVKGEKVKDDVHKLKKTIRKEKRKSVKSREDWSKRVKTLNREMKAKQDKREKNLKERREARKKAAASGKQPKGKGKFKGKFKGKK